METTTTEKHGLEEVTLAIRNWITAHQLARLEAEKAAAANDNAHDAEVEQ